jgi:uncharacterized membrane protein (Fun14 family)
MIARNAQMCKGKMKMEAGTAMHSLGAAALSPSFRGSMLRREDCNCRRGVMANQPSLDRLSRGPTLAVWLSTALALPLCLMRVVLGIILVAQGVAELANPQRSPPTRPTDPFAFDPLFMGIAYVLVGAILGWLQYLAVRRQIRVVCHLVGVGFLVLGVVGCMTRWETPWDFWQYLIVGAYLFIAVCMIRWGLQLAAQARARKPE